MLPFRQANPVGVIQHKLFVVQVCRDRLLYPPRFAASLRGEDPDQRFPVNRIKTSTWQLAIGNWPEKPQNLTADDTDYTDLH
jgi:hypothetical protein